MLSEWADVICPVLERGDELVLATAPALAGGRMIVRGDETSVSTFGGGLLEAEGQKRAGEVFRSGISQLFSCTVPGRSAGAAIDVFVELIDATEVNVEMFRALREIGRKGNCVAVAELGRTARELRRVNRFLLGEGGVLVGDFSGEESLIGTLREVASRSELPVLTTVDRQRFLVERC